MIKIGMSACFMYPDNKREVFGPKTLLYMGLDMSYLLGNSQVMPILIPELHNDEHFFNFLDQLDGIMLQGGTDINPFLYNEKALFKNSEGDLHRDMYETRIISYAIEKQIPILGICRGMQLLNVYFGGSLYQDIGSQLENGQCHQDIKLYDHLIHDIEFTKNSLFEKIHGNNPVLKVNSVHHQGIKKLGKNLKIEAICPQDKMIEAISWLGNDPQKPVKEGLVMGIQWHPEFFHTTSEPCLDEKPVMDLFLKNCLERMNTKN